MMALGHPNRDPGALNMMSLFGHGFHRRNADDEDNSLPSVDMSLSGPRNAYPHHLLPPLQERGKRGNESYSQASSEVQIRYTCPL
jgi:hypothetical protein